MAGSGTTLVPCDAFAVTCPRGGDAVLQRVRQPVINSGVLSVALDRCPYDQLYEGHRLLRTRNGRPPGVTPITLLLCACCLQKHIFLISTQKLLEA